MLPATELLPVQPAGSAPRSRPLLVPVLCGTAIAGSWVAVCLAMVPWAVA